MDQYLNDDDWWFIFNFLSDQKFMIRKILFYSPLLIIILLGILFYYSLNSETKSNSPLIGKQIPAFSIERLLNLFTFVIKCICLKCRSRGKSK